MRKVLVLLLIVSMQLGVSGFQSPPQKLSAGNQEAQTQVPEQSASDAIKEGIALYLGRKFKQALEKFEFALRQDSKNDEALGYAAVTAFRIGNQVKSRGYFLQRAELPGQKDTVKTFCYYRVALTYWREAHDLVAKSGDISGERLVYKLSERDAADVNRFITNGLEYVDRALAITKDFGPSYNVKNLLHSEAALVAKDEKNAKEHQNEATIALRSALAGRNVANAGDAGDFNQPTVRIAEFAETAEADRKIDDPLLKMVAGGRPKKRVKANFPTIRLNPTVAAPEGAVQEQTAAAPDFIKVEVLVSPAGSVLFTRVIDGQQGLNDAAILAAQGWKFEPATFEGKPVQLSSVISFEIKQKK
ncbi:MAG: energy transducer TonB [Blastocatellia bacterium]|nr:energy transducer TonB [Blastocatellia bacterium]